MSEQIIKETTEQVLSRLEEKIDMILYLVSCIVEVSDEDEEDNRKTLDGEPDGKAREENSQLDG